MSLTLIFSLGAETYGLEIDAIQEIIEDTELYFVPKAKGVLTGAINLHGQILAVINLPELLDFPRENCGHRWIVLTPEHKSLVLNITGVQKIMNLDLSDLQPPPALAEGKAIRGVAEREDTRINLLDTDEVIQKLEEIFSE